MLWKWERSKGKEIMTNIPSSHFLFQYFQKLYSMHRSHAMYYHQCPVRAFHGINDLTPDDTLYCTFMMFLLQERRRDDFGQ